MGGGPPASRPCCVLLLVAPLVFRAPEGPAAREIATREPKGSEWSISKPARALRTLRRPPHRRRLACWRVDWCVGSLSGQALLPSINFARNSPATISNVEFTALKSQRFWGVSKNDRDKLRAKFGWRWCRCCPWVSQPGSATPCGRQGGVMGVSCVVFWGGLVLVVTNVVNPTIFSLKIVVFGCRLTTFVTSSAHRPCAQALRTLVWCACSG